MTSPTGPYGNPQYGNAPQQQNYPQQGYQQQGYPPQQQQGYAPQGGYGGPAAPAGPLPKPSTTVNAGFLSVLLSFLAAVAGLVILASQGVESLTPYGQEALDDYGLGDVKISDALLAPALQDSFDALQTVYYMTIFCAVFTLIFALVARAGQNWARIVLIIATLPVAGFLVLTGFFGIVPTLNRILSIVALIAAVAALVLFFLPGSNQYYKARKAARGRR